MKILIIGKLTDLPEEEKNSYSHNAMQLLSKFSWDPVNPSKLLKDQSQPFGKLIEKIENLMLKCEAVFMLKTGVIVPVQLFCIHLPNTIKYRYIIRNGTLPY